MSTDKENSVLDKTITEVRAKAELLLGKDQYGEPIAIISDGGRRRIVSVSSKAMRQFLQRLAYKSCKNPVTPTRLDQIILTMEADAIFSGATYELDVRVTRSKDGTFLYDLGNSAVQISGLGWRVLSDPPICFRSFHIMKDQVTPTPDGNLVWIADLFNIQDASNRLMLLVWLVSCFVPHIPHPVLILHGQQGSGKSLLTFIIQELVDPAHVPDVALGDIGSFLQHASHRWLVPIDNTSRISWEQSDALCKLVTGTGIQKRALYTNDDDFFRKFRRVILLNGLTPTVEKSDLLDRSILVQLERISTDKRKTEEEVLAEFNSRKSELLGACFDVLSKAIKIKETLPTGPRERMGDFSDWGAAISTALGFGADQFHKAYRQNVVYQSEEVVDSSPLATVIVHYLRKQPHLIAPVSEAHKIILDHSDQAGVDVRILPKTPRSFGRAIIEATPSLERLGYSIKRSRGSQRMIEIYPPHDPEKQKMRETLLNAAMNASSTSFASSKTNGSSGFSDPGSEGV